METCTEESPPAARRRKQYDDYPLATDEPEFSCARYGSGLLAYRALIMYHERIGTQEGYQIVVYAAREDAAGGRIVRLISHNGYQARVRYTPHELLGYGWVARKAWKNMIRTSLEATRILS